MKEFNVSWEEVLSWNSIYYRHKVDLLKFIDSSKKQ